MAGVREMPPQREDEPHRMVQVGTFRAKPADKIVRQSVVMGLDAIHKEGFWLFVRFLTSALTARCAGRGNGRDQESKGELDGGCRHPLVVR